MYNPASTYRIQFQKEFNFEQFDKLLPYFQHLGVSTIYASPIFVSVPESVHGYDNVDPNNINPEIGTEDQLRAISQRLRQAGMGWVQDIVPNHMGYHATNHWLMDTLEKGPLSRFAAFFDTSLSTSFFQGRIMAPFLAESLDETIKKGDLTLDYAASQFVLTIGDTKLPLKPGSYATVLKAGSATPSDAIVQLLDQLDQLRHSDEPEAYTIAWAEFRQQLGALVKSESINAYIQECLKAVNSTFPLLHQLADEQHYRFCEEPETRKEMTYRRFFVVNDLICLNMDDETVFQQQHRLTGNLAKDEIFQGLRIDHIDGLFDPNRYLDRLRALTGEETYIVAEKILQANEDLPEHWPIQGTSGYDFLALVNNLLTNQRSEAAFRDFYHALIGSDTPLPQRIRNRKAYFLAQFMGGELENLHTYFLDLNLTTEAELAGLTEGALKQTIGELLIECPVYRYYGNQLPLTADESENVRALLRAVQKAKPELASALALLAKILLEKPVAGDAEFNQRATAFYQRLMQFTGPLMAKGVEDTLLYTYNCFVGRNEVGDSPERFGMSVDAFHQAMQNRQRHWPLAQNATATHDTKRGEDVRARLNVLTDLPEEWLTEIQQWQQLNKHKKEYSVDSKGESTESVPDLNDEYFIYQNLLGAYPMPGMDVPSVDAPGVGSPGMAMPNVDNDDFPDRFQAYLEKALQEAKRHTTGWTVNDPYNEGVKSFTSQLLDRNGEFWARFEPFHQQIADFGVVNSLTQLILKFTCPGIPDIYQGTEGWDLSLVDPDNRRPVDFDCWQQWLSERQSNTETRWADLWRNRFDGRIKFWLTHTLLQQRQQNTALFTNGDYIPLAVEGLHRDHVMAFARRLGESWFVVVVPLHLAQLCHQQKKDAVTIDWQNTQVILPVDAPKTWGTYQDESIDSEARCISVQSVFSTLPLGLLRNIS